MVIIPMYVICMYCGIHMYFSIGILANMLITMNFKQRNWVNFERPKMCIHDPPVCPCIFHCVISAFFFIHSHVISVHHTYFALSES